MSDAVNPPTSSVQVAGSGQIVRRVKVNRTRSPQEMIDAMGRRRQYTHDKSVVKDMPRGEGDEIEVVFFKPRPEAYKNEPIDEDDILEREFERMGLTVSISRENLEREFEFQGLKPVDPYSQAAVNEEDPAFADSYPNVTFWEDKEGKWNHCAVTGFYGLYSAVLVGGCSTDWNGHWWFAGVRK